MHSAVAANSPSSAARVPLIRPGNLVKFVGTDAILQSKVMHLCREVLQDRMPALRRAINQDDAATIQKIAHGLHGSVGMLSLPGFQAAADGVSTGPEQMGGVQWRQCCEIYFQFLEQMAAELGRLEGE